MAALSPDSDPDDILPALARNVVTNGYQASHSNEALEQTEYLKLVHRYLSQARELEKLAGESARSIKIDNCESPHGRRAAAHPRLPHARRLRQRSGAGNRQRAARLPDHRFRFPAERPGAGAAHQPSVQLRFPAHRRSGDVRPRLLDAAQRTRKAPNFIENFISDPSICRLYLGFSKLDRETAEAMRKQCHASRG